jgi:serine phosphatase RsbU (regulator of sigma subunit)/class 3 adenylate cyclase
LEDLYFSRLVSNAPPKLVEKVRSAPYLAKERRMVTAILITIANQEVFDTAIPEEERNPLLNRALDQFAKVVFEYEGTIAKLWQNTILVFFGAPISHEDDPLRAVHAASALLDEANQISAEVNAQYGVPIQLDLVLNTGPVLIGDIKSNLKFDFKSLNNTLECMDLAIRAAIPPCQIILFEDTYRFIKPFVKCKKLENIFCDDLEENLRLWLVDDITNQPYTMQRMPGRLNTALIGRQKELALLLELSETVLAGLGRVGLILGEPGIGKSRLILEWKRKMRSLHQPTRVRWIEAHGIAFGRELAYHLLKDLLRAALGIPENCAKEEIDRVLQNTLQEMIDTDSETLHLYLAHLLELPLSDEEEQRIHQLNAKELRSQYLIAVRKFFRNMAREQPLIIVLEDLHWADDSSIDLLVEMLNMTASSPILFCLVSRFDRDSSGWRLVTTAREEIGPRLTEVTLENLNEGESQSLVNQLIEVDELPEVIKNTVLGKSEGNPYFIEELVRMLVNEGVLTQVNDRWLVSPNIDPKKIPDSLQGLLSARIDRLPVDARLTLRVASVIGRTFPERVIEYVLKDQAADVELLEQLSTLESIGMIRVSQVKPELSYSFQHILIHEAAYHSIFEGDRMDLHLSAGNALESLYPDQQERLASQLAHHFLQGKNIEKAFKYLDLAGHVAMDAYANAEAESYFHQAIQITQDTGRLAHLFTDLGETLAQQAKHREAIRAWKQAITHHKALGNSDRLARVYAWSARSAWWGYDPKRSLEICLEGLEAVKGATESSDIAYLVHETGRAYLFNDQPDKARSYCEQALEISKRLDAFDVQAEALATIGILPTIKPQQAIAALEMAIKISEANNLYGPASRAYINLAAVIDNLGEIRLARDYRIRAINLGHRSGGVADEMIINQTITAASLWLADFDDAKQRIALMRQSIRQGDAYLDENNLNLLLLEGTYARLKGDFTLAIERFTDLIDRSRQTNDIERIMQANRLLAEIIIESHLLEEEKRNVTNLDIALSMISESLTSNPEKSSPGNVAAQCLLANIYSLKGQTEQAEKALANANSLYRNQPVMQDRVQIILAQARLKIARGDLNQALEYLHNSIEMFDRMEGRWWHARIWLEIGIVYLNRNEPEDVDQAQNMFREALAEFKDMQVEYYPDIVIEKLRLVKKVSRAQAIAHRKITRELEEAGRVQNSFIPTHSPKIPGYDLNGVLLPARETSGDFFDFIPLEQDQYGIVIADVGDKGAGAALYMAMSRTLIRTYAVEAKLPPEKVLHEVNRRILTDTPRGIFLTVVFGVLNPEDNSFTYVNAGHNPPYLMKQNEDGIILETLDKTGTLVGIFGQNEWEARTIHLKPGDFLILYTDGITEAQNWSGDFFGIDRLVDCLRANAGASTRNLRNAILEEVQQFMGEAPRLDDITLVIITRTPSS